jgi:hypothetical protein
MNLKKNRRPAHGAAVVVLIFAFVFSAAGSLAQEAAPTRTVKTSKAPAVSKSILDGPVPAGPRLGLIIGKPLGPVLGWYLLDNLDLQTGLGYDLDNGFLFFLDMDFHFFPSKNPKYNLNSISPFVGIGLGTGVSPEGWVWKKAGPYGWRYEDQDDTVLNVRFPFGCSYMIPDFPAYPFFQVVLEAEMMPEVDVGVSGGVGLQFFF